MNIELKMLAWTVVLGLLQLAVGSSLSVHQRGLAWNAGARDSDPPKLSPVASRIDRALRNLLETFPFAAAALAVVASHRTDAGTALGAQLYFGARLIYVGLYAAGIPYARTLVWTASMVGIVKVLWPLL
ncbi:MAG: MAPEG family protein [Deltaproteobacteria bacterium]|nr:MAPEG family protein [Deltaproteobacteria bacterium]